jgi:hypothetical protein
MSETELVLTTDINQDSNYVYLVIPDKETNVLTIRRMKKVKK